MMRMAGLLLAAASGLVALDPAQAGPPSNSMPGQRLMPMPTVRVPSTEAAPYGQVVPTPDRSASAYRMLPLPTGVNGMSGAARSAASEAPVWHNTYPGAGVSAAALAPTSPTGPLGAPCHECRPRHRLAIVKTLGCVHRKIHGDIPKGHCAAIHESLSDATWTFCDMFAAFHEWHSECHGWCKEVKRDCCQQHGDCNTSCRQTGGW